MPLGRNIKRLREIRRLTQQDLSDLTGGEVSQGAIAALEKRDSKMSRFAPVLSRALGITLQDLALGADPHEATTRPEPASVKEPTTPYSDQAVPLLSLAQAGEWPTIAGGFQRGEAAVWLPCPARHGPRTFCTRVEGESMTSPGSPHSYHPGDIIFVDPDVPVTSGARAVAKLAKQTSATFKQYVEEDGRRLLKALNREWSPRYIEIGDSTTVCGVVIGKWVPE